MMNKYWKTGLAIMLGVMLMGVTVVAQKGPQPKSKKEVEALQAVQNAKTPDDQLKAIDNVLENFADTEYKPMLVQMGMQIAEQKGDYAATITYAERVLEIDPKNVFALSTLALQTTGHTREFDLDKDEKLAKAEKYANAALAAMPTAAKIRPDLTDDQWNKVKADLTAQCHDTLGRIAVLRKKYDVAITEFQTAVKAGSSPDSTTVVRLGDAYLQAGKVDDAIASFDQAIGMADAPAQVKQVAQARKADALKKKGAPAPATPPGQVEIKK